MFRDCSFDNLYICGTMARCCNMCKNGRPKDEIPLEVQRWDKCCHNGKVKAQAWQWLQNTTMITSSQTTTYNLQEPKKTHKKPSNSKTQNGHNQNKPTSCNLQKYEFELKKYSRCKDATSCWDHVGYSCIQTFKHYRILVWHVLLTQVWILKFSVSYFVEFVLNFQWQRLVFFYKNLHHDIKNFLETTKLKKRTLNKVTQNSISPTI